MPSARGALLKVGRDHLRNHLFNGAICDLCDVRFELLYFVLPMTNDR